MLMKSYTMCKQVHIKQKKIRWQVELDGNRGELNRQYLEVDLFLIQNDPSMALFDTKENKLKKYWKKLEIVVENMPFWWKESSWKAKSSCLTKLKTSPQSYVQSFSQRFISTFSSLTNYVGKFLLDCETLKHSFVYFPGYRLHQPRQRCVCVPLGPRHDRREHHQGTGPAGDRPHLPLSQLQVQKDTEYIFEFSWPTFPCYFQLHGQWNQLPAEAVLGGERQGQVLGPVCHHDQQVVHPHAENQCRAQLFHRDLHGAEGCGRKYWVPAVMATLRGWVNAADCQDWLCGREIWIFIPPHPRFETFPWELKKLEVGPNFSSIAAKSFGLRNAIRFD